MALTLTRIDEPEFTGNDPRHVYETWKASGTTAVNDTAVATLKTVIKPDYIIGPFSISSVTGNALTVKSLVALGASDSVAFRVYGRAGSGM